MSQTGSAQTLTLHAHDRFFATQSETMKQHATHRSETVIARAQLEHLYQLMRVDPEQADDEQHVFSKMREACEERDHLQHQLNMSERNIEKLTHYLDMLQHDVIAIEQSRAWRIGFRLVSFLKSLTGRAASRYGFSAIHRTFTLYHHWKKSRD